MLSEDMARFEIALDLLVDNVIANDYCLIEGEDTNKLGCHTSKCRACLRKYIKGKVNQLMEKQERQQIRRKK